MPTQGLSEELQRAIQFRAGELQDVVAQLRGPTSRSRAALRDALSLVESLPPALTTAIRSELARCVTPTDEVGVLRPLLRHVNYVYGLVEQHLSHGSRRELTDALADEVQACLTELGVGQYRVVLSHGPADNFITTYGDLRAAVFSPLVALGHPSTGTEEFALFKVPRLEGGRVQWRPVLLGHETTHVAAERFGSVTVFDLQPKFDFTLAGTLPNPEARPGGPASNVAGGLYRIAEHWATELICDLMALQRYGPAAIAALSEYFECIGAMESCSKSHPPGVLRLRVLLDTLGPVSDQRLNSIIDPWRDAAPTQVRLSEPWAQYLADLFVPHAPALMSAVNALWANQYDASARSDWIGNIADCLALGRPGRETRLMNGAPEAAFASDVINAVWVARAEKSTTPIDRLAQKTLESISFVTRWKTAGSVIPDQIHDLTTDVAAVLDEENGSSVLSADRILDRLKLDDPNKGLVATPLCHLPHGVALDVRLGNKFIVFRRSDVSAFDPLALEDDPRALQDFIELAPNDRFVLHPNEVVLGATMEYLVLPDDLSGQVITRSSYGRLGLLSATAVQVHPRFRGCLTLELVNLSTIPISLTPGERIAQLILWKSQEVGDSDVKYSHSIGPEFSRVRTDSEAETLRTLRSM